MTYYPDLSQPSLLKHVPTTMSNSTIRPKCDHMKVYADHIFTSIPPQRAWICRRCGAEGTEVIMAEAPNWEYEQIKKKFG